MSRLAVGTPVPRFSLLNHEEHPVTSADLRGERYVLYFYPQDDTPGCTLEACGFRDQMEEFNALDVRILGVSPDDPASHRAFRTKYDLDFDLLSDPARTTMAAFGAFGEKILYGKTVVGVIRSTFVVEPSGLIQHTWYGPRTQGHAQRVRAALGV